MSSDEPKKRGRPRNALVIDPVINPGPESVSEAQAFAQQVWEAQSPDKPYRERLEHIARCLKSRGYSMEGVKL